MQQRFEWTSENSCCSVSLRQYSSSSTAYNFIALPSGNFGLTFAPRGKHPGKTAVFNEQVKDDILVTF